MNDIADKIWAAIQRPSPPVTKDEIVALVNEAVLPFEVESDAERSVKLTTTPGQRRKFFTECGLYEHAPVYAGQQLVPDAAELDEQAKIEADWAAGKFRIVPLNPGDKVITRVPMPPPQIGACAYGKVVKRSEGA